MKVYGIAGHGLLLLSFFVFFLQPARAEEITLSGAWAVYPTAVAWAKAFEKKHPDVKVNVTAGGAGKGASDAIAGLVDIGMVSRDPEISEIKKGIVPIYILHDAVFPVVSEKNPYLSELLKKGVSKQALLDIYIYGNAVSWDDVISRSDERPIHVYTRSDPCGAGASWAKYLGNKKQDDLKGVGVYGDPALLEVTKRDRLGISYNNFSYVFTWDGSAVAKGVKLLPIDANKNGKADPEEIYNTRDEAVRAIETGSYPAVRKNYFFVKGKPQGIVKEFIEFTLSDEGTEVVNATGTSIALPKYERNKILNSL